MLFTENEKSRLLKWRLNIHTENKSRNLRNYEAIYKWVTRALVLLKITYLLDFIFHENLS